MLQVPEQQSSVNDCPSYLGLTAADAIWAFLFYPLTLAPLGPSTNGGALGLLSIFLALGFSWAAFSLNRSHPVVRMAIQLPVTACITFGAIYEAVTQYMLGPELWFWW